MRRRTVQVLLAIPGLMLAGACEDRSHGRGPVEARSPEPAEPRPTDGKPVRVFDRRMPMGTYMAVTVYAPTEEAGRRAIDAAFQRVEEVENATSTYREHSDIAKVNRAAGGGPVTVSPHLHAVVRRALAVAEESGGAFDPTVGPLVDLWKRTRREGRAPSEARVAAALARVGYRKVRCGATAPTVQLPEPGMKLVLSGIAKGYAVDQAIAVLREHGIAAALVDAGGDMYGLGAPPERAHWLIGVRDPTHPRTIRPRPLRLRDRAVATSGDYEQFALVDGRRYSHILDPRTGRPVEGMTSVTVVAPDATSADAYATAASVLGVEAALALVERHPEVEILILHTRDGQLLEARSSGFGALEAEETQTH